MTLILHNQKRESFHLHGGEVACIWMCSAYIKALGHTGTFFTTLFWKVVFIVQRVALSNFKYFLGMLISVHDVATASP